MENSQLGTNSISSTSCAKICSDRILNAAAIVTAFHWRESTRRGFIQESVIKRAASYLRKELRELKRRHKQWWGGEFVGH